MRLIDANALKKRMYHDAFETDTDMQKWDSGCWIRYKMFENAIDSAPTINAAEVARGEWLIEKTCYNNYNYRCSYCDWYECHAYPDVEPYNFCPNCGADMRGADNE